MAGNAGFRAWVGSRGAVRYLTSRIELRTLVLLLLVAACVWVFAALADEVVEGETHGFDRAVLLALRNPADLSDPIGPGWIEEFGRDLTALGSFGILLLLTLAVAGFLWLKGNRRSMWMVIAAVGSGQALSSLAKHGFERPRPDLVPHEMLVYTASFPSGHSMMAAVTYLTLAALVARVQPTRALKAYVLGLAILLTLAIGASRVYLGVHWPSDVLAGWTAGAAWALVCWLAAWWIEGRASSTEE